METAPWGTFTQRIRKCRYASREQRQDFVGYVFRELLEGSVLDVGCFKRHLRKYVSGNYVGVDLYGEPDVFLDLEQGTLPFRDGSFRTVVCTDVLEHLESLHRIFDECIRVSSRWVIVSLPNCFGGFWRPLVLGKYVDAMKYYGLPVERPVDRHRWFFSASEAERFLRQRSARSGAQVAFLWHLDTTSWRTKAIVLPLLWSRERRKNFLTGSVWAVISTGSRGRDRSESQRKG